MWTGQARWSFSTHYSWEYISNVVSSSLLPSTRHVNTLKWVQWRDLMIKNLEHLTYKTVRLRKLWLFRRGKKAQRHLINKYKYLMGVNKEWRWFLSVVPTRITRGNGNKLKHTYTQTCLKVRNKITLNQADGFILVGIQSQTGHSSELPALVDPTLIWELS